MCMDSILILSSSMVLMHVSFSSSSSLIYIFYYFYYWLCTKKINLLNKIKFKNSKIFFLSLQQCNATLNNPSPIKLPFFFLFQQWRHMYITQENHYRTKKKRGKFSWRLYLHINENCIVEVKKACIPWLVNLLFKNGAIVGACYNKYTQQKPLYAQYLSSLLNNLLEFALNECFLMNEKNSWESSKVNCCWEIFLH